MPSVKFPLKKKFKATKQASKAKSMNQQLLDNENVNSERGTTSSTFSLEESNLNIVAEYEWAIQTIPNSGADNIIFPFDLVSQEYSISQFNNSKLKERTKTKELLQVFCSLSGLSKFHLQTNLRIIRAKFISRLLIMTFFYALISLMILYAWMYKKNIIWVIIPLFLCIGLNLIRERNIYKNNIKILLHQRTSEISRKIHFWNETFFRENK